MNTKLKPICQKFIGKYTVCDSTTEVVTVFISEIFHVPKEVEKVKSQISDKLTTANSWLYSQNDGHLL